MWDYSWCDTDETLLEFDRRKCASLDETKLFQFAAFLHPPRRHYAFPTLHSSAYSKSTPAEDPYSWASSGLENIAPRLLMGGKPGSGGAGAGGSQASTMPPGTTPLPPYKTVICRSYYSKGKCFRAEPEKCWFVHDVSEMRVVGGGSGGGGGTSADTHPFSQPQRRGGDPDHAFNTTHETVKLYEKSLATAGKAPMYPKTPPTTPQQPHPQQTGKKAATADPRLYKTEMCRFYEASGGQCRFGSACTFAHGVDELRRRRDEKTDATIQFQVDDFFKRME